MNNTQSHKVGHFRRKSILGMLMVVLVLLTQTYVNPQFPAMAQPQLQESPTGITYYVDSANGNDANPGTQAQPWRTIQKAANTMVAGDTATVLAASANEKVHVTRSGASGAPITFQAEGTVIMEGFTVNANYITIRGFEITNTPDDSRDGVGIYVQGSYCDLENNYIHFATRGGILLFTDPGNESQTTNCTVRNNRLYRNSQNGIDVKGLNHLIEGNEVWGSIQYHPNWANPPSWVDADGIRFFGSGHMFRGNYIHDISISDPENINPHIDAFQTWDNQNGFVGRNCIFEQNKIVLGSTATGFQLEGGNHDLIIRNNIVIAFRGFKTYKNGSSPVTSPYNISVVNNLFIGGLNYAPGDYPEGIVLRDTTNSVVKNNVVLEQRGQAIYLVSSSGIDVDYNLAYNSNGSIPLGTPHPHDLWGINPRLVDLAGGDYHLQSGSPAVDSGVTIGAVSDDYDGDPRPQGPKYDIGPDEASSGPPSQPPPQPHYAYSVYLPLARTRR